MKKFENVYSYDMNTGIFSGAIIPMENPMKPGTPLDIAFTTSTPPLPDKKGYVNVINADKDGWEYIENHIGEIVYIDGVEVRITTLGPLPEGASYTKPGVHERSEEHVLRDALEKELVELDKKIPRIIEDMIEKNVYTPNDIQTEIINKKVNLREKLRTLLATLNE